MQGDYIAATVPLLEKLIAKFKPQTSTSMRSAVVALYTADPQGILRYSDCVGLLQLDIDRHYKSKFLRVYDLDTLLLSFEVEIYYGFQTNYRRLNHTLFMFDYPKGSIAFEFRSKMQADLMKMKIDSQCPSLEEYQKVKERNIERARKKEEEGTFFGRIKNFFTGGGDKEEEQKESEVLDFKKNTSIQFDLTTGTFNAENVPPEWQEMFDQLGLDQSDLQNKDVMGVIVEETIMARAKKQAELDSDSNLSKRIQQVENEKYQKQKEYKNEIKKNTNLNLPPPPPPPPPLLLPPQASQNSSGSRANLLEEIRNNNLKLNHVQVNAKNQVNLDIADMNREQRNDHVANIRRKLQMRKRALNRRNSDDSDDE